LVVHHTNTPPEYPVPLIADYHVNVRDRPAICYHYVITHDGQIWWCNDYEDRVWHAGMGDINDPLSENNRALGVALVGDFSRVHPTDAQTDSFCALRERLQERYGILRVVGHKEGYKVAQNNPTACPGDTWDKWKHLLGGDMQGYPRPTEDTGWGYHDSTGVYAQPGDLADFARYMRSHGMTWFKLLVFGTNKVEMARVLAAHGIEVIVRLYAPRPHPHYVVEGNVVRAYTDAGARYFEFGNEPNLKDEWDEAEWNEGAHVDKVCQQWLRNQEVIKAAGGIPLLPALAPGGHYPHHKWYNVTFDWLEKHGHMRSLDGAALAVHNRPLNHPLDYRDRPGEPVPGCHFLDYEWIDDLVKARYGRSLPLLGTEAGYEPEWHQDPRYPKIDVSLHAQYNVELLRGFRTGRWRDSLFCQCMWFVAEWGHQHDGFAWAAWHDNRRHGGDLPVVALLKQEWNAHPFTRRPTVDISTERIRQIAWQHVGWDKAGIPYNPNSAFVKRARWDALGAPQTPEAREGNVVIQGFARKILWTREGEWDPMKINALDW